MPQSLGKAVYLNLRSASGSGKAKCSICINTLHLV